MTEPEDNDPAALLLNRIRPVAPSADLMQRLLAARPVKTAPPPVPASKLIRFVPRFATAAALLALAGAIAWPLFHQIPNSEVAVAPTRAADPAAKQELKGFRILTPQESRQDLVGFDNLGFTRDAQSRPVRLMRATWLDNNTYGDGNGTAPVRESRVRDELLPVVLTTY